MKKVLVLMLVLGMASLANAGLLYQINGVNYAAGSIVPVVGTSVVVSIYNEATQAAGYEFGGAVSTAVGSSISDPVATNNLPGGAANWTFEDYGWNVAFDGVQDGYVYGTASGPSVAPTLAGVLFSFTVNDIGTSTYFSAIDANWSTETFGGVTLTPEPATMLILGLGGLLLRRK